MKLFKEQKGFTLIELLVVIAIIGILASIVLASLNTARDRARDTSARASMSQIRAQEEIFYDTQNPPTYVGGCASAAVQTLRTAAVAQVTAATADNDCNETAIAWATDILLNSGQVYCSDSSGFSGVSTELGALTNCP